ncbi:MAG: TolC family protein [Gemmataceae bacterium]
MTPSASQSPTKSRKSVLARAIACGLLLALPACQIPKLRHAEPGPGLPAEYKINTSAEYPAQLAAVIGGVGYANLPTSANSADNTGLLGIQEFYDDQLLTRLLTQAISSNLELKNLEQEIQIARNEILARRGAYLPFVTVGARAGVDKPSLFTPRGAAEDQLLYPNGKHFPDPLGDFLGAFNFFWTPDIWRQLHNARYAAEQRYIAAVERRNYFVTTLVAEVAEKYYRLMALDQRIQNLNDTIDLQQQSYDIAKARFDAGRGTELAVQRFQAEVRKNQSEKLLVKQEIIEVENRINFLITRFPEPVERSSTGFFDLTIHSLSAGVPPQLLANRPDIRQAERELIAAGLDIKVARARFFPTLTITSGVGYQAFNLRYLFTTPDALIVGVAGDLVAPLINKAAIRADFMTANARQLEAIYNYQKVVLNAFTEVVNRLSMVEYYRKSIDVRTQQLAALDAAVDAASKLFQAARVEYIEVLFAQRDRLDARMALIDTKAQQLAAIVNAYQALGGGAVVSSTPQVQPQQQPQVLPQPQPQP